MINSVTLVGRMTKAPELKYSQSGLAICTFTLAVDRMKKKGEDQGADFIRCTQFGNGAEATSNFMDKGSLVGVSGRISTRSWEDDNGKRQYVTEVVGDVKFLESKSKQNNQQSEQPNKWEQSKPAYEPSKNNDPFADDGKPIDISDDDLPF